MVPSSEHRERRRAKKFDCPRISRIADPIRQRWYSMSWRASRWNSERSAAVCRWFSKLRGKVFKKSSYALKYIVWCHWFCDRSGYSWKGDALIIKAVTSYKSLSKISAWWTSMEFKFRKHWKKVSRLRTSIPGNIDIPDCHGVKGQ